jgi:hypothetical protein
VSMVEMKLCSVAEDTMSSDKSQEAAEKRLRENLSYYRRDTM